MWNIYYPYTYIHMLESQHSNTDPSPVTMVCAVSVILFWGKAESKNNLPVRNISECTVMHKRWKWRSFPLPALQSSPGQIAYRIGNVRYVSAKKCNWLNSSLPCHKDKLHIQSFLAVKKSVQVTVKKYNWTNYLLLTATNAIIEQNSGNLSNFHFPPLFLVSSQHPMAQISFCCLISARHCLPEKNSLENHHKFQVT